MGTQRRVVASLIDRQGRGQHAPAAASSSHQACRPLDALVKHASYGTLRSDGLRPAAREYEGPAKKLSSLLADCYEHHPFYKRQPNVGCQSSPLTFIILPSSHPSVRCKHSSIRQPTSSKLLDCATGRVPNTHLIMNPPSRHPKSAAILTGQPIRRLGVRRVAAIGR